MSKVTIGRAVIAASFGAVASSSLAEPAADGSFRAMVERPLFSPTRRPPPPAALPTEVPALPASPPPSLDVALSGIIAGGGGGVVLLKRPLDPAPIRVALGGQIDGWTVAEVHPRSVLLRREGRSVTIDLPTSAR